MSDGTRGGGPPRDPLAVRLIAKAFAAVSAALLLAMMLVTTTDVAGRYLFSRPLPGAFEITQILLGLLIYFALPAVCLAQDHVTVGLVFERLRGGARRAAGVAVNLFGAAVLAVAARELWAHGVRLASYNDVTIFLRAPTGPIAQVMAGLALVSALILVSNAVLIARGAKPAGSAAAVEEREPA